AQRVHRLSSPTRRSADRLAEAMLRSVRMQAKRRSGTQAAILAEIGVAVAEAIVAAGRRQYARVVDLLFPVRHRIALIGGSNAQQDFIAQLLIDAAIRSGRR